MSTDQQHLPTHTPLPPAPPAAPEKTNAIDLSVPKIVGGALAAMTTAALGSRLGVAGTLVGAAVASVVAAVASSLYTASLRHTGQRLRTVIPVRSSRGPADSNTADGRNTGLSPTAAETGETARVTEVVVPTPDSPVSTARRPRLNWVGILVGALAAFALAAAAVTGIELASGRTFSGGQGTTIGQVSDPAPASDPATVPTTEATSEPSAEPTAPATDEADEPESPAPEPAEEPQTQPSPSVVEPEPSAPTEPATPSASSTPRPSESASSAPPSAAPSASASG